MSAVQKPNSDTSLLSDEDMMRGALRSVELIADSEELKITLSFPPDPSKIGHGVTGYEFKVKSAFGLNPEHHISHKLADGKLVLSFNLDAENDFLKKIKGPDVKLTLLINALEEKLKPTKPPVFDQNKYDSDPYYVTQYEAQLDKSSSYPNKVKTEIAKYLHDGRLPARTEGNARAEAANVRRELSRLHLADKLLDYAVLAGREDGEEQTEQLVEMRKAIVDEASKMQMGRASEFIMDKIDALAKKQKTTDTPFNLAV